MKTIKKAQLGNLIKKGVKAVEKVAPKVQKVAPKAEKELTVWQKMRLEKGKPLTHFNVNQQKASKALKKSIEARTNPEAAAKKMTKAQRQAKEIDDSYRKNGGPIKKAQNGTSEYSDPTPLFNKIKKSKDSLDNARKTLKEKMKKEQENYKSKVSKLKMSKLKMKNGGSLGMKSVKAGFDNNPGVTRADIITAATKKAKKGMRVKKAQSGTSVDRNTPSDISKMRKWYKDKNTPGKDRNTPAEVKKMRESYRSGEMKGKKAKSGTTMKKCRYGCK